MAKTVGRLEFLVSADGKGLDAQVRAIGKKAGAASGAAFTKSFDDAFSNIGKELANDMESNGELSGISFTRSMQNAISGHLSGISDELARVFSSPEGLNDFADGFDSVDDAANRLRSDMKQLNDTGALNDQMWNRLGGTLNQWLGNARKTEAANKDQEASLAGLAESLYDAARAHDDFAAANDRAEVNIKRNKSELDELSDSLRKHSEASDKSTSSTNRSSDAFDRNSGGMSTNAKQIALIIAAIAAGSGDIAALGSVAGSSLVTLGGALAVVGTAVGVAVAGFQGMLGPIEEITEPARAAAEQFQVIGDALGGLQDIIQSAIFDDLADPLATLAAALPELGSGLGVVAGAVGDVLGAMATAFASTENIAILNGLLTSMEPVIAALGTAAMAFGGALSTVFVAVMPSVQIFADGLANLATQFGDWLASAEGQTALADFFGTLQAIMPSILSLVGSVGKALADLVTPETIQMTIDFLDNMAAFMPLLSEILGVVSNLDVFGLISELLLVLGEALEPILPQLSEMATLISDTLSGAFATLAPTLGNLLAALAPLASSVLDLAVALLNALLPAVDPIIQAVIELVPSLITLLDGFLPLAAPIGELAVALADVLLVAIEALIPILDPLIDSFLLILDAIAPLIPIITDLLILGIVPLTVASQVLSPIIGGLMSGFNLLLKPILDLLLPLGTLKKGIDDAGLGFGDMRQFVDKAVSAITSFGGTVSSVMDGVIGSIRDVIGWFEDLFNTASKPVGVTPSQGGGSGNNPTSGFGFAAGGTVNRPTRGVFGEAGREALVPLDRPLSEIDPSVRGLAAIAQGKSGAGVNIAAGAIVVQSQYADPSLVAAEVLDAFVVSAS
jgi:septum formation inhibitor MinC